MQSPRANTLLWKLMAAVILVCQARPNMKLNSQTSSGLRSECIGNLMRLSLDKALAVGNQLEVEAVNGSRRVLLTPGLAAQCGYSMESDPWGNTRIYTSLLGCYVDNRDDTTFNVGLKLEMFNPTSPEIISHDVKQTCSYSRWAAREVLCDRNYMEVSHYMPVPDSPGGPKGPKGPNVKEDPRMNAIPGTSAKGGIWKITFYTPEPISMVLKEAEQAGYGAMATSNRLVIRSPYNKPETYSEDVAGISMEVFKVSVYYSTPQGLTVEDMAAACPIGGVLFTEEVISWHVPRSVTPLVDSRYRITEVHMGMNGQRLDKAQISARGYSLSSKDFHIVMEIPVGAPDGYYKSHALDYQYHITYSVEPMLEVLWRLDNSPHETRYKVLFPITTPLMPRPPRATDQTVPESRVFSVQVGTFLQDVELKNITFFTGTFSVEECVQRGFVVQEQNFPNGTRTFFLQVAFDEDVIKTHNPEPLVTLYTLPLTFGFMILPEHTPFSLSIDLVASLHDVVLPSVYGSCDQENFYITVAYGNQGSNVKAFETLVGYRTLTPEIAMAYNFRENATHFNFVVPYTAQDTAFEVLKSDSVQARIDLLLWDPKNSWPVGDLYLACHFPLTTIQCFPNGTMTALAVKVESVPNLGLNWLRLRDKSCKPVFTNDRFALFSFNVDSCGTTRTFFDPYMVYENEISLDYQSTGTAYSAWDNRVPRTTPVEPEYRQTISCYFKVDQGVMVGFGHKPGSDPAAEIGTGQLAVQMRLAKDSSYGTFYQAEDYPVAKYLKDSLYFEVDLMYSFDPKLEVILKNCWATTSQDRTSLPSWDIILDTCENREDRYVTILHPVLNDARVPLPSHVKRFSMKMFTFTKDNEILKDQIYVHCDAVICDSNDQTDGACRGQCTQPTGPRNPGVDQTEGRKKEQRNTDSGHQRQTTSGPILLKTE